MSAFGQIIIYCFSGTGNSRNVAKWFSEVSAKNGTACKVINIADADRTSVATPPSDALLVFVSPIHGFNYPPVMLNFILRFPQTGNRNKVLLMNTRAGMLIGKFNLPGLTGIAFYFSAFILKLKGFSINGMVPVDLPSNWISIHPGLNAKTVTYLHEVNKAKVKACAEKIISGGRDFRAVREIVQDIVISPVSLGYFLAGRFMFAKTFYASKDCNNCDICIKGCPVKAIIKVDKRPFWTFRCESCMKCMGNCPKKAIEAAHGFIIGYLLFSSVLTGIALRYFNLFFNMDNRIADFILETLVLLFCLGLFYRLIHYLMRFTFIERLMVFTSLTKYKFWGRRYKALNN